MIRDDPSRSELIRPGLAVQVDLVRLLYLPNYILQTIHQNKGKCHVVPSATIEPQHDSTPCGFMLYYLQNQNKLWWWSRPLKPTVMITTKTCNTGFYRQYYSCVP